MIKDPIKEMQSAVDIVLSSAHDANKIAATLFNENCSISKTNYWPKIIIEKLGKDIRIGDSSGTVHAEVECILNFPETTENASIAITDPCCPNCAKFIAEAGIKNVYIDHKGFNKDFAIRRGDAFKDMSLRILANAGVTIYEVVRKENCINVIFKPAENYVPIEENPIEIIKINNIPTVDDLLKIINGMQIKHPRWGCAVVKSQDNQLFIIIAFAHFIIGSDNLVNEIENSKYDFYFEPINRILTASARNCLKICDGLIFDSGLPSPREMVNLVAAGVTKVYILDNKSYKKETSIDAMQTLADAKIIEFCDLLDNSKFKR